MIVQETDPQAHRMRHTARLIRWLFFLRVPFLYGSLLLVAVVRPLSGIGYAGYLVGTSALIALLIWHERDRLQDFHIDRWAVGLFLFLKPVELAIVLTRQDVVSPITLPFYAFYLVIVIWLGWALYTKRVPLPKPRNSLVFWIPVGILLGIAFGALDGWAILRQMSPEDLANSDGRVINLSQAAILLLTQASRAGLSEEPLFRGFLWGYLKNLNWSEKKILLAQTGLFGLVHFDLLLIGWPVAFLFTFIGGLMLGWLAWRSRSISVTIISHGFANTFGNLVTDYRLLDLLN